MQPFVNFSTVFCSYRTLHNWRRMSSNFLLIHTEGGISLRSTAFQFNYFPKCSSSVRCPSLMSSWPLVISSIGLSAISGRFPSSFFKCSFFLWSFSSWLVAKSFALKVPFFQLNLFIVFHANCDCLSSTEIFFYIYLTLDVLLLFFLVCFCLLCLGFLKFLCVAVWCCF